MADDINTPVGTLDAIDFIGSSTSRGLIYWTPSITPTPYAGFMNFHSDAFDFGKRDGSVGTFFWVRGDVQISNNLSVFGAIRGPNGLDYSQVQISTSGPSGGAVNGTLWIVV